MKIAIIAAVSKGMGIGKDGVMPWMIPKDLKYFKHLTQGHIVVMGRKTYDSIPEDKKPLSLRINIVITNNPELLKNNHMHKNLHYTTLSNVYRQLTLFSQTYSLDTAFVIGGQSIYAYFIKTANELYLTQIDKSYECDAYFPHFENYNLVSYVHDVEDQTNITFLKYLSTTQKSDEYVYLNLLKEILKTGEQRDDRTGTGTLSVFARQLRFNLEENTLPLLTTKFVGWKTVLKELLWFLRGETDSKILEQQGVNIWKLNSTRQFLDQRGLQHYREGDIGPMYFFNIFHYGAEYKGCDADYTNQGYNQMKELIKGLKEDPNSRRHMLTTYNPATVSQSVLAPCHGIVIQFYAAQPNTLSCHVYIRSSDTILGLPFNIASYAMLTHIIAKKVNRVAKELIISTGDTHIYSNHIHQAQEQLSRKPFPFPKFMVCDSILQKDWKDLTTDDFDVIGYFSHNAIKAPMAV